MIIKPSSTFPFQLEVLPRLTVVFHNKEEWIVAFEWIFWGIFVTTDKSYNYPL